MILPNCINHFPSHKDYLSIAIHQNIEHVQLSNNKLDATWGVAELDPVYNTLYQVILRGWPDHLKQVPRIAQHFWGAQDELSIEDNILLRETEFASLPCF